MFASGGFCLRLLSANFDYPLSCDAGHGVAQTRRGGGGCLIRIIVSGSPSSPKPTSIEGPARLSYHDDVAMQTIQAACGLFKISIGQICESSGGCRPTSSASRQEDRHQRPPGSPEPPHVGAHDLRRSETEGSQALGSSGNQGPRCQTCGLRRHAQLQSRGWLPMGQAHPGGKPTALGSPRAPRSSSVPPDDLESFQKPSRRIWPRRRVEARWHCSPGNNAKARG
ncbi:hypothetical protein B0T11DRAFT_53753 [Plectosphaerella cucumerina]|uniref:Uncharacterized protein n=1 Tax=Plectosphaerella cucumerina TaxID=40658 RepID=A0A8K0TJA8_9PEZI|nr:hypothetical protein B0T11DRAFT_53753 [Plectosphaerella cucumerina]